MAITGFKSYLKRDYNFKRSFINKISKKVINLFFDANSLFYEAYRRVYQEENLKKSKEKLLEEHLDEIVNMIKKEILDFKPELNFILAVDGPVNSAKMNQQKERRFKKDFDSSSIFDLKAITPGTDFMFKLDKKLETFLLENKDILPPNVIYSSHLDPGEAEHKIFKFIKENKILRGDGVTVLNALDNDLVVLTTLSELENIVIVSDDSLKGRSYFDVEIFKRELVNKMKFYDKLENRKIYQDFNIIMSFIGNDFLHRFPNIPNDMSLILKLLFQNYKFWTKKTLTNYYNDIIWENYFTFLKNLYEYKGKDGKFLYIESYKLRPEIPYKEIVDNTYLRNKENEIVKEVFDRELHTFDFNLQKFSKDWYEKQFNSDILQWNGMVLTEVTIKEKMEMVVSYLKTLQWVQYYYTLGLKSVSDFHYYKYKYTPLMGDVLIILRKIIMERKQDMLRDVKSNKNKFEITPIHQLLSVIPKSSKNLLPKEFRKLYDTKKLKTINPETFIRLEENMRENQEDKIKVLAPLVNLEIVNSLIKDKIPENMKKKEPLILKKEIEIKKSDLTISEENLI